MIDYFVFFTILAMATVTYLTRITGYLLLHNKVLNPRLGKVLEAIPGCVLIAVIAPAFATTNIANLLALAITLLLASRFSLLPTVIISIAVTALLRHYIPY
ncbi:AzlD family protein [Entomomonas asaccharolytica]|uniref:AzlD family protein n=1 Tax=Entomomonas asaccharolytica TaxID=2785331 RepID=A0A974NI06_9GAMM|nr:AzlD family protein [Entomomonas asaccharolytica]QQP86965.1 AzlD family protein [Entomomonas asaccharolytica]